MSGLLRFNKKFKYIIFDCESESLNLFFSRPWQLSFLVCEGDKVLEEHDYHIDIPNLSISKGAQYVTKFNWDKYNKLKKPMEFVWEKFAPYLFNKEYYMVGHNILGFDVYQLNNLMREMDKPSDWSYINRCIDTHALAKGIALDKKPDPSSSWQDKILWQYKLINNRARVKTNLTHTAKNYGIEVDPDKMHDALEDIKVNQKVFLKQIYEIEI